MSVNLQQITTTGVFFGGRAYLFGVTLTADVGIASLQIRDGAEGPIRLQLRAQTNTTTHWRAVSPSGVLFNSSIEVIVTGSGAFASLEYEVSP